MVKKLKVAVVGCGYAGSALHIPWYAANSEVELVGLVDSNITLAQECTKRWRGRAYNNITEMLDKENPDMVSVATPVHLHAQHTIECLKHSCHVLCEKPMAPTLEECQQMIDSAKENNVILGIGFDKRFNLGCEKAHEVILSGRIGKPLFMRVNWSANCAEMRSGTFRVKSSTGGGAFQDVGSHFIDLFRWWLDSEINIMEGMIDICYPEILEVEDHAVATFRFKNGILGTIEISWVGPTDPRYPHIEEVWVYGTDGAVKVLGAARLEIPPLEIWDKKTRQWQIIHFWCNPETLEHYQYKRMINEFVSCVKDKRKFITNGEDGKKSIEAVLALYQSSHTNQKVSLPLKQSPNLSEIFTTLRKKRLQR